MYTPTHNHASHIIVHFYIRQHFRTSLIQFKKIPSSWITLPHWSDQSGVNSNINSGLLWLHTWCTCSLITKLIYYLYPLLVFLKILLNIFFCDQTLQHWSTSVKNRFTRLCEFPINYFYIICKYYPTG